MDGKFAQSCCMLAHTNISSVLRSSVSSFYRCHGCARPRLHAPMGALQSKREVDSLGANEDGIGMGMVTVTKMVYRTSARKI